MTPEHKEHLSLWELKNEALSWLQKLKWLFAEFSEDIDALIFYIENDNLGNNQAFLLSIAGEHLSLEKDTPEKEKMYRSILDFSEKILKKQEKNRVAEEKKSIGTLIHLIAQNPLVHKENLRFRDISVILVALKHIFPEDSVFTDWITKIRTLIHKRRLGTQDVSLWFEDISLDIKVWMGDGEMLLELFHFAHKIYGKYPRKFREYLERSRKIKEDEPKDRQEIWSIILATMTDFKQKFHGSPFGARIAELKDTIQSYNLLQNDYPLQSPWGVHLDIKKEDTLDEVVEKLVLFLAWIQEKNTERFPKETRIRSQEVIASKEKEKVYWRDILAGLDFIQSSKYNPKEYPELQQFREIVEDGKLGEWLLISLEVDGAKLYITKFDSEKRMKNKVLEFMWELKVRASVGEDMGSQKIFWKDILLQLKAMEEAYGSYADYQLLVMSIESKTLGIVKDFSTIIDGIALEIFPTDSDKTIREKLEKFVQELKEHKKIKIDENAMQRMRERLEQAQREQEELRKKYDKLLYDQEDLKKKTGDKMKQQEKKIKQLEDELENSQRVHQVTPSRYG